MWRFVILYKLFSTEAFKDTLNTVNIASYLLVTPRPNFATS